MKWKNKKKKKKILKYPVSQGQCLCNLVFWRMIACHSLT